LVSREWAAKSWTGFIRSARVIPLFGGPDGINFPSMARNCVGVNMTTSLADHRVPPADECVLRYVLDKWAERQPDKPYVVFAHGTAWSYAQTRDRTRRTAAALAGLGVRQGDHVACWLSLDASALQAMLAINYLGAVYVPFNTAYRGGVLEHVIANSDAAVLIADARLLERLADVNCATLNTVIAIGDEAPEVAGLTVYTEAAFEADGDELPELEHDIRPWDTQSIVYTSGTTGPSKGVLSSYLHAYSNMGPEAWPIIGPDDRYLITLPMFHIGGSFICNIMLCHGGSIAMAGEFKTDTFWHVVKTTRSTVVFLLGVMATFLTKQAPSPQEREHGMTTVFMVPLLDDVTSFAERFHVGVYTIFNMTEAATPTFSAKNPTARGTCGKVREGVEARLVDENDCEVPIGEVGEMIVRMDRPWAMNHGYYKDARATAKAWRNGWFHTGDAFRRDDAGNFYFVDRIKDAIRRRGENISSFEVEVEVGAFPVVRECAAIPVPSSESEDEVLLVVAPVSNEQIDPEMLFDFLVPRMAHFMLPRFIRVVQELPKTPTAKVQKHLLRNEGVTEDTWDRNTAGIKVTRQGVIRSKS
jgi:crotonobetaine/carnitine-CoA ligase